LPTLAQPDVAEFIGQDGTSASFGDRSKPLPPRMPHKAHMKRLA